jgi:hypothetical protein
MMSVRSSYAIAFSRQIRWPPRMRLSALGRSTFSLVRALMVVRLVLIGKRPVFKQRSIALTDQNGDIHDCVAESFSTGTSRFHF